MKNISLIFLFGILSTYASAKILDSLDTSTIRDTARYSQSHLTLLYEPGMTEKAGIEDILTLHYGITRAEDAIIGTRWFSENTFVGKSGGILARSVKYIILDCPVDIFSHTFIHEYFGHGMRWRNLTDTKIKYHFKTLPPYGGGGGSAHAINSVPLSYHEDLALAEGGIESQALLNRAIALRWMASGEIQYRDAAMYFSSFLSNYSYINYAPENNSFNYISADPDAYVRMLNAQFGISDWNHAKMNVKKFKSQMKLNLLNPFCFYSIYYFAKTYLLDGNSSTSFPTIHIADVRYLPVFRVGMTPFGTENHLENYLKFRETAILVDFRIGNQTFYSSWGGIGLKCINIASVSRLSADLNLDIWKQPELILGGSQLIWNANGYSSGNLLGTPKGGGVGGAISARGYYDLTDSIHSLSVIAELGYKSVGFLEGYNLDASPIIMIGVGYQI
jgi:hypothetical protein